MSQANQHTKLLKGKNNNNFNLLRFVAAGLVIVSHGIELPTGLAAQDWAHQLTGEPFSWYAVNLFFVISGYLIFASWEANPSLTRFVKARFLRIIPGLFVMLVLSVLILGLFYSRLDFARFIRAGDTQLYFLGCLSVISVKMNLPGVFESNPLPAVNGSLWTLRYEIVCYAGVAALGGIGLLAKPTVRRAAIIVGIIATVLTTLWIESQGWALAGKIYVAYQLARLGLCFLLGAFYREYESIVLLRLEFVIVLLAATIFAIGTLGFAPIASLTIAYTAFWCAFVPNAPWCQWTRTAPDYSYGIYIYAFPVQQAIIATLLGASTTQVIVLGFIITIGFAALSWHFVEKPALALKGASAPVRQNSSAALPQIDVKRSWPS